MAATLVCQRRKVTTLQQRWQWQHCNTTVHTSVAVGATDSAVTAVVMLQRWQWHRWNSSGSESAETTMCTVVWQRCQWPLLSQWCAHRCQTNVSIAVSCDCCHSTVISTVAVTMLCSFSLSQRCVCFRCYNWLGLFSLPQCCAHRCRTAVRFLLCEGSSWKTTICDVGNIKGDDADY